MWSLAISDSIRVWIRFDKSQLLLYLLFVLLSKFYVFGHTVIMGASSLPISALRFFSLPLIC